MQKSCKNAKSSFVTMPAVIDSYQLMNYLNNFWQPEGIKPVFHKKTATIRENSVFKLQQNMF